MHHAQQCAIDLRCALDFDGAELTAYLRDESIDVRGRRNRRLREHLLVAVGLTIRIVGQITDSWRTAPTFRPVLGPSGNGGLGVVTRR